MSDTNGDQTEALRQQVRRQEVIIDVLKQRIFELEVELVNGRIAAHDKEATP